MVICQLIFVVFDEYHYAPRTRRAWVRGFIRWHRLHWFRNAEHTPGYNSRRRMGFTRLSPPPSPHTPIRHCFFFMYRVMLVLLANNGLSMKLSWCFFRTLGYTVDMTVVSCDFGIGLPYYYQASTQCPSPLVRFVMDFLHENDTFAWSHHIKTIWYSIEWVIIRHCNHTGTCAPEAQR